MGAALCRQPGFEEVDMIEEGKDGGEPRHARS
jgi:hypothetical protein